MCQTESYYDPDVFLWGRTELCERRALRWFHLPTAAVGEVSVVP